MSIRPNEYHVMKLGRAIACFAAALLVLGLAGCEGDSGNPGPVGPIGDTGPAGSPTSTVDIADAEDINAEITGASIGSPPVVDFTLTDGSGQPVSGLPADAISFTVAKLTPGANGNASTWQSYVTRVEESDGDAPDVLAQAEQATTENGANGELVDNGDGSYTYTFATDLDAVEGVEFEPSLTHRVGFEIRGFVPVVNPVFTFNPGSGATTSLFSREIVEVETCNVCHNKLALHGNGRFDTKYCVTCHNPGTTDQDSGNTVDFKVMIHKIHRGAELPSVEAGTPYVIYGFREGEHDYSHVEFPQDIRNCQNCHDASNPDTPDAVNWTSVPTMEACGSCHDDVDFATGTGHSDSNLAVTNADCTVCHREGGLVGAIDRSHALLEQEAAAAFKFNIVSITNTMPGDFPAVRFSITDPTNNDAAYDIQNDDPFIQGSGASRIAIDIAWDTTDYSNIDSGSAAASGAAGQPISLNPLFGGATDNGDGTFTITSATQLPLTAVGTGQVGIEGHPAVDVDGDGDVERIPVQAATEFFTITDTEPVPRRQVVDLANCQKCHQSLSLHGANRTDNINLCLGCHTPESTDLRQRLTAGVDSTTAPDGKNEEAIHFKRLIHAIHSADKRENPFVVYGFGGSEHDFSEVEFPGILQDCKTCHLDGTFYPVEAGLLATTIDTGADLADPLDDLNITPNAAACGACHDSSLAEEHMKQNGGAFDVMQQADGTMISMSAGTVIETCALCHGEGRVADVKVMHGFD